MKSLTKGTPIKLILIFAIPLFIGQLFQLFYSVVDTRIVGSTLGESALASVGSTTTFSDLLISFINGMTNGFSIVVATYFGAKDIRSMKKTVAATFMLGCLAALSLSFISVVSLGRILGILNVSDALYPDAYAYIKIILLGLVVTALYNICAAVLRAIGDTVLPLVFLIISSFINIILDYTFILKFNFGVKGAAYATVISQGISVILCLIYINRKYEVLRLSKEDFRVEIELIIKMIRSGLSMALMYSLVNFGTLSLQTSINTFGTATIVAHTAARKITSIFMIPFSVFGQSLATYCGQNLGAKEYRRIKIGIIQVVITTLCWDLLVLITAYTVAQYLVMAITGTKQEEIIQTACRYLRFNTVFYFVTTFVCLIRNALQGIGDTLTPVISSFLELASKVAIALLLAPAIGYWGIIISEPLAWTIMVIPLLIQFFKNPIINGTLKQK